MHGFPAIMVMGRIIFFKSKWNGAAVRVGQLGVAAGFNHLVGVHEGSGVSCVRDDETMEAPLLPQHIGDQRIAASCPGAAQPVE